MQFIRLLLTITCYCLAIVCSGAWLFVTAQIDASYGGGIVRQWGALVTSVVALVVMVAVDSLLFFHFYLIFWLKMTTF